MKKIVIPSVLAAAGLVTGCQTYSVDYAMVDLVDSGEYALAGEAALDKLPSGPKARENVDYGLASMRLGMTQLADGQVEAAELPLLATYEILRTQGINDGRGAMIFLQNEDQLIYWKGEPFEQAMAYAYFSAQLASVQDWYNAVVAADNAIFQLANFEATVKGAKERALANADTPEERAEVERDFGDEVDPQALFVAAETASAEQGEVVTDSSGNQTFEPNKQAFQDTITGGYVPEDTNFVVGYMMQGIASLAAGDAFEDQQKARDAFARAVQYNPSLEPLTEDILAGNVNTVFWVDYGKGPEKFRYGYADAFAKFRELMSGGGNLRVQAGSSNATFPVAADINGYALDHRWLNLQNVRVAKAALGDALIATGAIVAASSDDWEGAAIGIGIMVAGWLQRQGAAADIRHVEIMPQRVYFAGVQINEANTSVEFSLSDASGATLKLPGINPPDRSQDLQFRYVRLNNPATNVAPAWAVSGNVVYGNDSYAPSVAGDAMPFIMGGTCVRVPSTETLSYYQQNGNLLDLTLTDLENIYRDEGITWELGDQRGVAFRHVLEGGTSLVPPLEGTAGFARLFCQRHPAYVPRGTMLQDYLAARGMLASN